jgi:hypothetical protein
VQAEDDLGLELWDKATREERQQLADQLFEKLVLPPDPAHLARTQRQRRTWMRSGRIEQFVVRPEYEALVALCRSEWARHRKRQAA